VISYVEHLGLPSHPFGHSIGRIVSGEFKGQSIWEYDLDLPSPTVCAIGSGLVALPWGGFDGIGISDPGLEP
jgi:hypothetical protein